MPRLVLETKIIDGGKNQDLRRRMTGLGLTYVCFADKFPIYSEPLCEKTIVLAQDAVETTEILDFFRQNQIQPAGISEIFALCKLPKFTNLRDHWSIPQLRDW